MGAHVIALTSSAPKSDTLRAYGAHDVVLTTENPNTHIADLTHGRGVDVVLDNVGLPTVLNRLKYRPARSLRVDRPTRTPEDQRLSRLRVLQGSGDHRIRIDIDGLVPAVTGTARLRPGAGSHDRHTLDDVVGAHRAVEKSSVVGRAVLVP